MELRVLSQPPSCLAIAGAWFVSKEKPAGAAFPAVAAGTRASWSGHTWYSMQHIPSSCLMHTEYLYSFI